MRIKNITIFIITSILMIQPHLLWATRSREDYGIVMVFMFLIYSLPAGLFLVVCSIYLIAAMKSNTKPPAHKGRIVLILSLVLFVLSGVISLGWMYRSDWHPEMVQLMLAVCIPIMALSALAAGLAIVVKKRSLMSDEDFLRYTEKNQNPSTSQARNRKIILIVSILALFLVAVLVFRQCFM